MNQIPSDDGWEWRPIRTAKNVECQNGLYRPAGDYGSGTPIIRINDFDNDGQPNHDSPQLQRVRLRDVDVATFGLTDSDILINRVNSLTHIGKSILISALTESTVYESNMMRLRLGEGELHAPFVAYLLHLNSSREYFRKVAKKAVAQASINQDDVNSLPIPFAPLPEQKKIAAILSTWDRAIELTEKLLAARQKRKVALMQLLFTGKVRVLGCGNGECKKCQLGDVASNSARRNGTAKSPIVYSVTNSVGMIPMGEDVVGDSIDRYKTVGKHDFAYNPMRINVGSIAMWDGDDEVLVSPDYVVFQCGPDLDAEYLNHFRKTHYWHQFVNRSGGGSVRVRIYFSDLAELALKLPPFKEQKAIAAVLNTQDREIELLRQKRDALRRQKKGLMQQLLTGKVRVNVTESSGA